MSETTFHLGFRNSWKQLDMSIGCWNNHLSVGHVFGQFWWQWDHFCENLKFRKSGLRLSSTERSVKIRQIISTVCLFYKNGRDGKWQAPRDWVVHIYQVVHIYPNNTTIHHPHCTVCTASDVYRVGFTTTIEYISHIWQFCKVYIQLAYLGSCRETLKVRL